LHIALSQSALFTANCLASSRLSAPDVAEVFLVSILSSAFVLKTQFLHSMLFLTSPNTHKRTSAKGKLHNRNSNQQSNKFFLSFRPHIVKQAAACKQQRKDEKIHFASSGVILLCLLKAIYCCLSSTFFPPL
jgi:hypothetical protein